MFLSGRYVPGCYAMAVNDEVPDDLQVSSLRDLGAFGTPWWFRVGSRRRTTGEAQKKHEHEDGLAANYVHFV